MFIKKGETSSGKNVLEHLGGGEGDAIFTLKTAEIATLPSGRKIYNGIRFLAA